MIKAGICMQFVNKWNQSTEKKWMNAKWTNIEDIIFYFIFFCKESQTSGKHLRYIEVCGSVILVYYIDLDMIIIYTLSYDTISRLPHDHAWTM